MPPEPAKSGSNIRQTLGAGLTCSSVLLDHKANCVYMGKEIVLCHVLDIINLSDAVGECEELHTMLVTHNDYM